MKRWERALALVVALMPVVPLVHGADLVAKINRDVYSLRLPEAKHALLAQDAEALPAMPGEFGAFLKKEIGK